MCRLYKAYQKVYASMHDKATGPHKTQFRRTEDYGELHRHSTTYSLVFRIFDWIVSVSLFPELQFLFYDVQVATIEIYRSFLVYFAALIGNQPLIIFHWDLDIITPNHLSGDKGMYKLNLQNNKDRFDQAPLMSITLWLYVSVWEHS